MTAERIAELRTKAQAVISGESNIGEMYDALGADDLLELLAAAEENAALQAEVRRLREDAEWQPISTAPKPGIAWKYMDLWAFCNASGRGERYPCSTLRGDGKFYDAGGNELNWEKTDDEGTWFRKVTHWRPLPPAPTEDK